MKIKIEDYPTFNKEWDKDKTEEKTKKILKKIGELQNKMYAQNKFSLLIVLQGTDASGKDGVTKALKNRLRRNMPMISCGGFTMHLPGKAK